MKKFGLLSLVLLSACNITWGPHSVDLTVSEGVTMQTRKGAVVEFESDSQTPFIASYRASKKLLVLQQTNFSGKKQDFEFKNVVLDERTDRLVGEQSQTGQNLAINVGRTFLNEEVTEGEDWQSCTYYESRPREHCYRTDRGRWNCQTRWEQVPVSGRQRVHYTQTERRYQINGALSQDIGTLGLFNGEYSEITNSYRALSSCH